VDRDKTVAISGAAAGDDYVSQGREAIGGRIRSRVCASIVERKSTSDIKEDCMKISEDWLSVILAFALLILALVGVISGNWMVF
jgi:hypothetical protein